MAEEKTETERWAADHAQRIAERFHDRQQANTDAANEATGQLGPATLKTSVLINGGACLAVLTFISTTIGETEVGSGHIANVANSIMWFALGVAAAAAGLGFTYLTMYCQTGQSQSYDPIWTPPYHQKTKYTRRWGVFATVFQCFAVGSGVASIVLFIVGMFAVKGAIVQLIAPS